MAARIRSTVNGVIKDEQSRDDLRNVSPWNTVSLVALDTATTYAWTIAYKPPGSTSAFSGDVTQQSPGTFTVDKEGPYLIRLTVDLGLPTENTQFVRLRFLTIFGDLKLIADGEQNIGGVPIPVDQAVDGWTNAQNTNITTLNKFLAIASTSGRVLFVDPNAVGGVAVPDPITGTVEGYADYDRIQDAIDFAVTQGASALTPWAVLVRPGTYIEDVTFAPFVGVIGWPGNTGATLTDRTVVVRCENAGGTGTHEVATPGISDQALLVGLLLENVSSSVTAAVVRKSGTGTLTAYNCVFSQLGIGATVGAALEILNGSVNLDSCRIQASNSVFTDRVALRHTDGSLVARQTLIVGTSGAIFNSALNTGVTAELIDSRVISTGGAGSVALVSSAENLLLEYSRVEVSGGNPLLVHPTGAPFAGDVGLILRWSYIQGDVSFEVTGVTGTTGLTLGACEYNGLVFPGGTPITFTATTKSTSLFYDNSSTGLSAETVQDALDEIHAYASLVRTLDDAYDGGVGSTGAGRRIVADQGAVEIVDAASPSEPVPPSNSDGHLRVVGNVEVGSIGKPEIDLDPNPFGNGPMVRMGRLIQANDAPFGSTAILMGRSTGAPEYNNYNLRVQTESEEAGSRIGRLILRGGDALDAGGTTPTPGPVYVHAGGALGGDVPGADVFLAPGIGSGVGPTGSTIFVRPETATPATLTATGAFVGGVSGTIRFAVNMGAIEVAIDASDNLATVLAKFNATTHVTAIDSGGGIIKVTSLATGPNAEIHYLNDTVGGTLDIALGTFAGQSQVDGTWPCSVTFQVTACHEISIGANGLTGPLIYNADTGDLTVLGRILEPTGILFTRDYQPDPGTGQGVLFVSDGTGGTVAGDLYYNNVGGTPSGTPVNLTLGGGGSGTINVQDEGVPLGTFDTLNFVGVGVLAVAGGTTAHIYIPPALFVSHWNTSDGTNGNQAVGESISRVTTHIPAPSGGEGFPFKTNGWAGTNQDTTDSTSVTFTTPGDTTGFGGDSTMTITVYDADGVTALDTYTTPIIVGNAVHTSGSGRIVVTITNYGADAFRFKAKASVVVDTGGIFSDNALAGGRYHVIARHTTDTGTDGSGPYDYTQSDLFLDTDPTTPAINGLVGVSETGGGVLSKHLSGIEYYIIGSAFTVDATNIDQLNRNTSRISDNLHLDGTEYGLPILTHSPFGTGSANFTGWANFENIDNVDYQNIAWNITTPSYRYIGPTGNVSAYPRDPWANGASVPSSDAAILVDTYGTTATDLAEDFDDESRRQDATYNGGLTTGNWVSTATLGVTEALVMAGQMMVPNESTYVRTDGPNTPNADWTTFKPNTGGANPNYSALTVPVSFYRTMVDVTGLNRASFQMVFVGTFIVDASTDLANGDLKIYIRRRASAGGGDFGTGANPLELHGAFYNFATFDDGVTDGHIREASSLGNTVNGTFGGFSCEDGFFIEIEIVTAGIKIDRYDVIFF